MKDFYKKCLIWDRSDVSLVSKIKILFLKTYVFDPNVLALA